MEIRPRGERGTIPWQPENYGSSVLGCSLEVWLPADDCKILLFAGIHGEEGESTFLLSRTLRMLSEPSPHCAIVLAANPDGLVRGTRCNANNVELNRNFPTKTWRPEPVPHRSGINSPRDILLSPGSEPGSEPETKALIKLINKLSPISIIAIHSPLACIEDPEKKPLAQWLASKTNLPLVGEIGHPTPGSFGTWCTENSFNEITYELPLMAPSTIVEKHSPVLLELLTQKDLGVYYGT